MRRMEQEEKKVAEKQDISAFTFFLLSCRIKTYQNNQKYLSIIKQI